MKKTLATLLIVVLLLTVTGCSSQFRDEIDANNNTGKIVVVAKGEGVDENTTISATANSISKKGKEAGIDVSVILLSNKNNEGYTEAIESAIKTGSHFIVVVGEDDMSEITTLAEKYQGVQFEVIGKDVEALNTISNIFRDDESGFVAGYIAAKKSKSGIIGFIGTEDNEQVNSYRYGYIAGARYANKNIKIETKYTGVNAGKTKGYKIAEAMFNDSGVDVIYQKAEGANQGILDVAKDYKKFIVYSAGQEKEKELTEHKDQVIGVIERNIDEVSGDIFRDFGEKKIENFTREYSLDNEAIKVKILDKDLEKEIEKDLQDVIERVRAGGIDIPKNYSELKEFLYNLNNGED